MFNFLKFLPVSKKKLVFFAAVTLFTGCNRRVDATQLKSEAKSDDWCYGDFESVISQESRVQFKQIIYVSGISKGRVTLSTFEPGDSSGNRNGVSLRLTEEGWRIEEIKQFKRDPREAARKPVPLAENAFKTLRFSEVEALIRNDQRISVKSIHNMEFLGGNKFKVSAIHKDGGYTVYIHLINNEWIISEVNPFDR